MSAVLRSRLLPIALAAAVAALASGPAGAKRAERTVTDAAEPFQAHVAPWHVARTASGRSAPEPSRGQRAARAAVREVGKPYRWGGESPATGFDCSGLVRWAYGQVGMDLPHSSYALYGLGSPVAERRLTAGDLLFFEGLGHVAIYVGRGRMVHAPQAGRTVEIVSLTGSSYGRELVGARRVASL